MTGSKTSFLFLILLLTVPPIAGGTELAAGRVRAFDGLEIVYDAGGAGDPALVFLHCWGCDRTYWRGQMESFAGEHRVVAVDLAGHGASGAERETWTVAALAGDVVTLVEALELQRVILVGHSIGGPISLEVARLLPERVVAVVGVDTLFDVERSEPPGEEIEEIVRRIETDFRGALEEHVPTLLPDGADPKIVDRVVRSTLSANRTALIGLLREHFDEKAALAAVKVPVRCINHAPLSPRETATAVRTNQRHADFAAVHVKGVGHYVMLERPEELNARLRKTLAALLARLDNDIVTFSRIDKAWQYGRGEGTRVAVLDWLFDLSPEASAKYDNPTSLVPGQEIGSGNPWHGEWMAQIVHRVAPAARILPIRARPACMEEDRSKCDKRAYEKYLIEGIRFAADQGAVAVTSSMGTLRQSAELTAAIDYAEGKGTLFVDVHPEVVAIVEGREQYCKPPQCDERIVHAGIVSVPGHSFGPDEGRDVYTWPYSPEPEYKDGWGLSNGPPTIGGVIALMKGVNSALTPQEIRDILAATAFPREGFQVLDAEAAVREARQRKR